jgi:hypothetical protein
MYIQPTTNIRLLKDVPLDTTYDHTIYFASATAQYNYFVGLQKYNLTNYTYQRVKRGVARVGIKADNLYDCNYMMFQNTAYGNKWFYAFITAVEFVNNECAEIYFELDVMQTWFFDCEPDYCFVEREHSVTDNIGEHIEPESVNVGEYVAMEYKDLSVVLQPMGVMIMIMDDSDVSDGTLYDGIYGGCTLFAYNRDDTESIKSKLNEYVQKPDTVIAMYMFPVIGTSQAIPDGGLKILYSESSATVTVTGTQLAGTESLDGYVPKNKKLYTYPYNFFHVDNASGSELNLRYEFFENRTPKGNIRVPITMPIQCVFRPTNYKGSGGDTFNNESITLSNYPMCSWGTDAFKAWLAQNAVPIGVNTTTNAINGALTGFALGGSAGAVAGGIMSASSTASQYLSQGYQASIAADMSKGNLNNGGSNVGSGKQSFYGGRMCITAEYARMIDDYFTMFGYATRRLKKPNRNSRPHWNYVKTVNATVTGSVPADDMRKICSIYDNGITFWKNGSEVGQYNLDNTV